MFGQLISAYGDDSKTRSSRACGGKIQVRFFLRLSSAYPTAIQRTSHVSFHSFQLGQTVSRSTDTHSAQRLFISLPCPLSPASDLPFDTLHPRILAHNPFHSPTRFCVETPSIAILTSQPHTCPPSVPPPSLEPHASLRSSLSPLPAHSSFACSLGRACSTMQAARC